MRDLYKAPKKEILKNRKAFYELKRRKSESIDKWLQRIQKCIDCCDFPDFVEFLVIDRFVCSLNKAEMEIILNTEAWSLKQLLEHFLNRNGDKVKSDKPKRNVPASPMHSESVNILKILPKFSFDPFILLHGFQDDNYADYDNSQPDRSDDSADEGNAIIKIEPIIIIENEIPMHSSNEDITQENEPKQIDDSTNNDDVANKSVCILQTCVLSL